MASDEAIERLRTAIHADPSVPGRAWRVFEPEGERELYLLVELGLPDAVVAVGTVDTNTGALSSHAELGGAGPHLSLTADDARRAAGLRPDADARLVWRPSRQSASPLYPLWQVTDGVSTAYVDMTGAVTPRLDPGGPG